MGLGVAVNNVLRSLVEKVTDLESLTGDLERARLEVARIEPDRDDELWRADVVDALAGVQGRVAVLEAGDGALPRGDLRARRGRVRRRSAGRLGRRGPAGAASTSASTTSRATCKPSRPATSPVSSCAPASNGWPPENCCSCSISRQRGAARRRPLHRRQRGHRRRGEVTARVWRPTSPAAVRCTPRRGFASSKRRATTASTFGPSETKAGSHPWPATGRTRQSSTRTSRASPKRSSVPPRSSSSATRPA